MLYVLFGQGLQSNRVLFNDITTYFPGEHTMSQGTVIKGIGGAFVQDGSDQ